jgi:hypothetical protein
MLALALVLALALASSEQTTTALVFHPEQASCASWPAGAAASVSPDSPHSGSIPVEH